MDNILDGKSLAKKIKSEVKELVSKLQYQPRLDVILVGSDQASNVYVNNKEKSCKTVGIDGRIHRLESADTETLLKLVGDLNADDSVDGILVQLPLPKNVDSQKVLQFIDPNKDVDGFHPVNVGKLLLGEDGLRPCTPSGIMRLFDDYNVELSGKKAVVIGRSNIVGKPMAVMLLEKNATVTICHSRTSDLQEEAKNADVLISAVGRAEMVKASWVKEGAIVVDVGMNRNAEGKLVGDVDFESVSKKAKLITPVPGGVGPLTVAMLMYNTYLAGKKRRG